MRKIAFCVVPARWLNKAANLMESVRRFLPEFERRVVVLDADGQPDTDGAFDVLPAEKLWGSVFIERAFFYDEEEFCRVTEAKAVEHFCGQDTFCLLLRPEVVLCQTPTALLEAIRPNNLLAVQIPPVKPQETPPPKISCKGPLFDRESMHGFCGGPHMSHFLQWVNQEFDRKRYMAFSTVVEGLHGGGTHFYNPESSFYYQWPYYGPLYGCTKINLQMPHITAPFSDVPEDAVFVDFVKAPQEWQLSNSLLLAQIYGAYKQAVNAPLGKYKFDYFEDGTPVFAMLRPYYSYNYRLRTACRGNPFAHRPLFTDKSVILEDESPLPFPPTLAAIYHWRDDLVHTFPDGEHSGRQPFAEWFLKHGLPEYGLQEQEAYYAPLQRGIQQCQKAQTQAAAYNQRLSVRIKRRLGLTKPPPKPSAQSREALYPPGINLAGYIRGDFGLGQASRSLAADLTAGGLPLTIIECAEEQVHTYTNNSWAEKITNTFPYNVNLMYTNARDLPYFMQGASPQVFKQRYNIGYWAWELPEFPDEWCDRFDCLDEVWTLSEFAAQSIRTKSTVPVFVLPPSVVVGEVDKTTTRATFGLPEDTFVFLMMYDVNSVIQRKNPQGAVEAFKQAFGNNPNITLVIKANMPPGTNSGEDVAFLNSLQELSNVKIIAGTFPCARVNALIALSDAFVSLHRSEGFGLGPAEAMYLGKPAIVTGWSGNMEYTSPEVCCPVKYKLVKIDKDYAVYKKGMTWAEPDVEDAALAMRRLVEDKAYYQQLSQNGSALIREKFSPKALGERAKNRLQELGLIP